MSSDDNLRHACRQCGGSCQGVEVALTGEDEAQRILQQAGVLGVSEPLNGRRLRRVGGRCVFLADDGLCRIHAKWGLLAKPLVCRQYPLVVLDADGEQRIGIDPGCFTHSQTWRSGPSIGNQPAAVSRVALPAAAKPLEQRVLALIDGSRDLITPLAALTGETEWPTAYLHRWIAALQRIDLPSLLADPDTSPSLTDALTPLAEALPALNERELSPPALSDEMVAYTLDATSRMVWLRLCTQLPSPAAVALLALSGAVSCAWVSDDEETYGRALAGWLRSMRAPAVLGRLFGQPGSFEALMGR